MHILMSGATGLIGRALRAHLEARGDTVTALTRRPQTAAPPAKSWNPTEGHIDPTALEGVDAVIHLAGESIASGRWTPTQKKKIKDSRVLGTQLLARTIVEAQSQPRVWISSSAIGFYGNTGPTPVDETAQPGSGFLAEVCKAWEAEAEPARQAGIRVVHPRIGVVLAQDGGALEKMLTPFRLGLGGQIGSGTQFMSWIALKDVVGILVHALDHPSVNGPLNLTAPQPVTNAEFTRVLGRVLRRPTFFTVPSFAARLGLGEMADELLLTSAFVVPSATLNSGYSFEHRDLESCLKDLMHQT